MMTRKHFEGLATALRIKRRGLTRTGELNLHTDIVYAVAQELSRHNDRFDFDRFVVAAGVKKTISEKTEKLIDGYRIEYVMEADGETYPGVRGKATLYQYDNVRNVVERLYKPKTNADYIEHRKDLRDLVLQCVGYNCEDMRERLA